MSQYIYASMCDTKVFESGPHTGSSYFTVRTKHPEYFLSLVDQPVRSVLNQLDFIQYCMGALTKKHVTFDETQTSVRRVDSAITGPSPNITLYFDGCSKGNPGKAGAGACMVDTNTGVEVWSQSVFVGDTQTNNVAEYHGLLLGLKEVIQRDIKHVIIKGDSKLVIE